VGKKLVAIAPTIALIFVGCVSFSGLIDRHDTVIVPKFTTVRSHFNTKKIIKGFGSIEISYNGEKHRGEFELINDDKHGFYATFYAPFGGTVGTIVTKNDTAMVHFQGQDIYVSLDKSLDTLGFKWGRNLIMKDFLLLLSGVIPTAIIDLPFVPESISNKGFDTIIRYALQSKHISLHFSSRLSKLKRITLDYSTNENPFFIVNEHFLNNIPRYISIKTDEWNYLTVRYTRIVTL
jgi:hypothetical protein